MGTWVDTNVKIRGLPWHSPPLEETTILHGSRGTISVLRERWSTGQVRPRRAYGGNSSRCALRLDERARHSLAKAAMGHEVCAARLLPVAPKRKTPAVGGGIRSGPLLLRSTKDGVRSTPYRLTPKPCVGNPRQWRGLPGGVRDLRAAACRRGAFRL